MFQNEATQKLFFRLSLKHEFMLRKKGPNTEFFLVGIHAEYRKIQTRKNSVFVHFSRSVSCIQHATKSNLVDFAACCGHQDSPSEIFQNKTKYYLKKYFSRSRTRKCPCVPTFWIITVITKSKLCIFT